MKTGSIFSLKRFLSLLKRHFFHSYKTLLLGLLVGFGISFLVVAFLQFVNGRNQQFNSTFLVIGIFGYALLGGFYISTAFSPFRTKEKAQAYIMLPGTALEKLLVEFIYYPFLFLLLFPILYLTAYELSTSFITLIRPDFVPFNLKSEFLHLLNPKRGYYENGFDVSSTINLWPLWLSASFSIAMAFFLGAVAFKKQVMLKTLLVLIVYFGFCIALFYYLMSELEWAHYHISNGKSFLTPSGSGLRSEVDMVAFFSYLILCWGLLFSTVSFFKFKEKEV